MFKVTQATDYLNEDIPVNPLHFRLSLSSNYTIRNPSSDATIPNWPRSTWQVLDVFARLSYAGVGSLDAKKASRFFILAEQQIRTQNSEQPFLFFCIPFNDPLPSFNVSRQPIVLP